MFVKIYVGTENVFTLKNIKINFYRKFLAYMFGQMCMGSVKHNSD